MKTPKTAKTAKTVKSPKKKSGSASNTGYSDYLDIPAINPEWINSPNPLLFLKLIDNKKIIIVRDNSTLSESDIFEIIKRNGLIFNESGLEHDLVLEQFLNGYRVFFLTPYADLDSPKS